MVRRASALLRAPPRVVGAVPELEDVLPEGGLRAGSVVELLADGGVGALALALRVAARRQRESPRRVIALVDTVIDGGGLYPLAVAQAGVELARTIITRPPPADVLLCLEEALRSRAVAATVARISRLSASESHRLRLAARAGDGIGLLVRPLRDRTEISGASARLEVGREGITPLRVRGGAR